MRSVSLHAHERERAHIMATVSTSQSSIHRADGAGRRPREESALPGCSSVQNTAPAEQRHQPLCARVSSRWTLQSRRVQGAVNTAVQATSRRDDDSLCQLVQPFPLPRPYVHWLWRIDGLP